ncbi:FAD-dependent monooxygenase [Streptomyces sp. bgisy100]|uniref:FAD-dependent monooxygenase n=1 Tax=Streptomyces sp. bgisy100 TaxID=3413783 RepID=UPI003D7196CF
MHGTPSRYSTPPTSGEPRTPTEQVDVLVAGASTVGLFTAMFLARHGVPVLAVERHSAPLAHPRAMGVGPRTVELLREAGIDDAVDARCVDMSGSNLQMFSAPTLATADLDALAEAAPPRTDDFRDVTPRTLRGTCPQGRLDTVAIDAARAHGATVAFGTELLSFVRDEDGVEAELKGPEGSFTVRARYLVAADGARSPVRSALGIAVSGPGELGQPLVSVLFRSDLRDLTGSHTFVMCDITTPEAAGGLLPVDGDREWIYHTRYDPAAGQSLQDFTPERCRALVRSAVGVPGLEVEIVDVLPWQVRAAVADRFRSGRVLLAGDAAHVIPPVGAFGMNTGVADAHNLAWKLAAVLRGTAGPGLLDTYEAERRPVALTTMEQSLLRLDDPGLHWGRGPEAARARAAAGALNAPVVHLGYRYDSAAVVDARPALPSTEDIGRALDGAPGSRLPHRWLRRGEERVSTLDLAGGGFALLTGPDGGAWLDALPEAAAAQGVTVAGHRIGGTDDLTDLTDAVTPWPRSVGISDSGALLVRPDGFIGRRIPALGEAPGEELRRVLASLLCRTPAES